MSYTMFRDLDQKFYIKYLLFDYVANRVVPFKDGRLVRLPYAGEVSLLSGIKKEDICLPDYNNHWLAPWEYLSGDPRFIFSCDMKDYWLMNETGSRKINNFFHPYIRNYGILSEATPKRSLGIRIVFQLNRKTD